MKHLSSFFTGLARSLHRSNSWKETGRNVDATAGGGGTAVINDDATLLRAASAAERKNKKSTSKDTVLRSSGTVRGEASGCFVSVFSRRGEKGTNQDCAIVWEDFGCQHDTIFCGIFDGHGTWGHYVAKCVRESLSQSLLCNWQEALSSSLSEHDEQRHRHHDKPPGCRLQLWRDLYLTSCAAVDKDLKVNRGLDAFHSGTTALTVVKQGDLLVVANVGDSRAVLATLDDDGSLASVQLTVDFKPSVPQEAERIRQCKGRVFCLHDEPGLHRLWLPDEETPGLAMSRAFGDHCVKDFGLISVPEVTHRNITKEDQFIVLATDGVWDVVSNQEAVAVISSTPDRSKSAKRLVEYAARAWRKKRQGVALDDCSAICIFFLHSASPSPTPPDLC